MAMMACARYHQAHTAAAAAAETSIFLVGRDSHKSVFDALDLCGCNAALLPCEHVNSFGVTLGVSFDDIYEALQIHKSQVVAVIGLCRMTFGWKGLRACFNSSYLSRLGSKI